MPIRKLAADDRVDEIVNAVETMIVRSHTLAFGMNQVAAEIASSRALIYVYFEGVPQIIDELCRRHLAALADRLGRAGDHDDVSTRASGLGRQYLGYLLDHGPALHYILRDGDGHGSLEQSRVLLRTLIRTVVGEASARLQIQLREAMILVELLMAIPDSLAQQLRNGRISLAVAHETCDRLITDLVADLRVVR
ncbi:TetR/AcrR family transcriptional regulator [Sphingomonas sp.]|uniref:TetR/AcrR family transcriptional regulator n=1 Tax=Sphingomonas sp. TaxID=28214 RepID=UPI0035C84ECB